MRKRKKNNYFIIILLLCLITVGFATLSTTLSINGNTKIKGNTWDVFFTNVQVKDGSVEADIPVISNKINLSFEVQLEKPGDFYEFTVDVKNAGTIDAMIDSISKTSLTSEQSVYLDYAITGLKEKVLLSAGKKKTVTVRVSFKDVTVDKLPSVTEPISLSFSFNAVQADSTAIQGLILDDTNGNGKADQGELVTVGTERFYVISNNDGEVRALAEWNLLVGNELNIDSNENPVVTSLANPTGLQDSNARGVILKEGVDINNLPDDAKISDIFKFPWLGTVAFSSSTYWDGTNGEIIDLSNSNNLINGYLTNYKNSLKDLGLETKEVTLITKSELENLGCDSSEYSCINAPSWVYSTSYWSRSAFDTNSVWLVGSYGEFGHCIYHGDYVLGVRPVISFLESEI